MALRSTAASTGAKSEELIESTAYFPIPGHANTNSTNTVPPRRYPYIIATMVDTGMQDVRKGVPEDDRSFGNTERPSGSNVAGRHRLAHEPTRHPEYWCTDHETERHRREDQLRTSRPKRLPVAGEQSVDRVQPGRVGWDRALRPAERRRGDA